jgi:hypothetical protein
MRGLFVLVGERLVGGFMLFVGFFGWRVLGGDGGDGGMGWKGRGSFVGGVFAVEGTVVGFGDGTGVVLAGDGDCVVKVFGFAGGFDFVGT